MDCPFCHPDPARVLVEREEALALLDAYPVSPGHALVVTRRHVRDWFAASRAERLAVMDLLDEVRALLDARHHPDGWNIGANVGAVAGQTVFHLHVHLIPRYRGDLDDPAGGVRLVRPERGNWRRPGFVPHIPMGAD